MLLDKMKAISFGSVDYSMIDLYETCHVFQRTLDDQRERKRREKIFWANRLHGAS